MSSPQSFKKLSVIKLTNDFREGTAVVSASLPPTPPDDVARLRVLYAGINASDVNFTNGRYFKDPKLPFDCGFEALAKVEAVGEKVKNVAVGGYVVVGQYGSFAEYLDVAADQCIPVPEADPAYIVLPVSASTAAVAIGELGAAGLEKKKRTGATPVALVTAAAGGTGQIAVQLLKHVYGCTVIGTCSTADKATFLKSIGCDFVINYKTENLDAQLTTMAPNGLDLVYECVGGEVFNTAVAHLALHGQVIIIGSISSYKSGVSAPFQHPSGTTLESFLLIRSAALKGFLLPNFRAELPQYVKEVLKEVKEGKVKLFVDKVTHQGVEGVADGVDRLYSGESYGKVVVRIQSE